MPMINLAAAKRRLSRRVKELRNDPSDRVRATEQRCGSNFESHRANGDGVRALSYVESFAIGGPRLFGKYQIAAGAAHEGFMSLERSWFLEAVASRAIGAHSADYAADLLTYAIIVGDREIADWMADFTERRLDHGADKFNSWRLHIYPRFALGLYRRWTRTRDFGAVTGVYAEVAARWATEGLADALDAACEHHLDRVCDEESVGTEFLAFGIVPIELTAIRVVREREGLPMPELKHPLANTPLAEMPIGPSGYDPTSDPWVQRIMDVAKPAGMLPADWDPARKR